MATIIDPPNSVWPNGLKVDSEGYVIFYPLGTNKVDISSVTWPTGDTLISPFVYKNDKLVGFIDTKALTISENTTIYLPFTHIEADFSAINKGQLQIHAPNATTKKASWKDGEIEDIPEAQFKYKGCTTLDNVKTVDANYQTTDIVDGTWSEPLWDLEDGEGMFSQCKSLVSFNSELPKLKNGKGMFVQCSNLKSFSKNLSNLTNGNSMFGICLNLASFVGDLSNLQDGRNMFRSCTQLNTFTSNLQNLILGELMFESAKLNTDSVENIAATINKQGNREQIDIGIANSTPNQREIAAFNTIASRNWIVYVKGKEYTPTATAATVALDENGEKISTPIPYYAKPVPSDEEYARYVDSEGNFFKIVGGQFIYGDDLSTYGMFTCEEDAAANMRLTKIKRN